MTDSIKGQCLCGGVAFTTPAIERLDVCHCNMCRRWTGGPFIGADYRSAITLTRTDTLAWYDSSEWAKRGFCSNCGSSLFYRLNGNDEFWAVSAGALDLPDGLPIEKEIFIDEKPDYYAFAGERPRLTGPEFLAQLQGGSND